MEKSAIGIIGLGGHGENAGQEHRSERVYHLGL